MRTATENPLESLHNAIVFDSLDWGQDRAHAWIYGIVVGWDDEDDGPDPFDAMREMQSQHGWNDEAVARLRRLRTEFRRLHAAGEA